MLSNARLVAACLALALLFPATSRGAAPTRHSWTQPGVLRISSALYPRTLNPLLATQTVESAIGRLTTDILVSTDEHGAFVPRLAREVPTLENGDISRDGLTITYKLRAGVTWHDGAPFTSRDVAFTFGAIMNRDNDIISRHGYDVVASVATPNPLTVVFHLKHRFAPFVATVFGESDSPYAIVPAHLLEKYKTLNDVAYNAAPIGTGPFKIVSWERGDRITFVRNDAYYLGKPALAKIVWRFVADENTAITLLRTHEIDWIYEPSPNAYKQLRLIPDIRTILPAINGYIGVLLNTMPGRPTSNVHVRRAIAMALDKARLTQTVTYGVSVPAVGDLPSFLWSNDPALKALPHDLDAAKAEMAKAGYIGKRLTLDLVFDQGSITNRVLAVQLQAVLRDIGIDTTTRPQISSVVYGGYGAGGTLARGKYDIGVYVWVAGIDPDNSAQFTCANRPPGGYNQTFYCSHDMDVAQDAALSHYDRPARKAAYATIERRIVEDAPLVVLWWTRNVQAFNPDLQGFDPNPVVETWDAYRWSI